MEMNVVTSYFILHNCDNDDVDDGNDDYDDDVVHWLLMVDDLCVEYFALGR